NLRLDLDGKKLLLPVHFYGDHTSARRGLDNCRLHLLLQLFLHLLGLFHHLLQIHLYSPFAGLIWAMSPRKTSRNFLTKGSSFALSGVPSVFICCSLIIRDTETGLPTTSLAMLSSTALCSFD